MCEICGYIGSCNPHCPNYTPAKPIHHCSACGEGIYPGEEYIQNDNGECRHWDCFFGMRDLLEWLGYTIETMEENIERDY